MRFIPPFQAAQDGNRVFNGWLINIDGHEAAGQSRVAFDIFTILVQRRRAETVQLAPRESRLDQVGRIHRAICFAGADQGVHFVNEQHNAAFGLFDFFQHRFQTLLELAAKFRTGNQGAHVEREQALVFQAFRDVAIDDAQGQAFGNRCLADARFANQDRIILGPAGQDLDGAANFLIAANHWIQFAGARILGQVARIFLQGLIAFFGIGTIGGPALAKLGHGRLQLVAGDPR